VIVPMLALAAGLFAPAAASGVLGIEPLDGPANAVATEIVRQLSVEQGPRPIAVSGDPSTSDCSAKPYAAVAQIETTAVQGSAGWSLDAGMLLEDCAGWSVDEFHEMQSLSHAPTDADAEKLGINLLIRLHMWMSSEPVLAHTLFSCGLAYEPNSRKPAYFYRLFKTSDGNLRAYVRPGGPAYDAGLRTNDIVEKIDDRWWWEYGTYPSERLAFDGRPHNFDLKRGTQSLHVQLGAAFVPDKGAFDAGRP
jgi:hypothetical protein